MPPGDDLRRLFADRLQEGVALSRFTSSRTGGAADFLIEVRSADELRRTAAALWQSGAAFRVLGGGSNVLVADAGVREVVILNHAQAAAFHRDGAAARVEAESGASLGGIARRAAERGLAGLEWAATVPGTVGGAVVGNAGAHGGDVAGCLHSAEVVFPDDRVETWPVEAFDYGYRSSRLKREAGRAVVLGAVFGLAVSAPEVTRARVEANVAYRQSTQPPGASWGSMFKNPPGDFAGRLLEAAGLKGLRVGQAEISERHANFFLNLGGATAADVARLLIEGRRRVREAFGVDLELEIELLGDWDDDVRQELQGRPADAGETG